MNFDSREEEYFYWWALELQEAGFITAIEYHPKPFLLFTGMDICYVKQLKTKSNSIRQQLLSPHEYQADFLLKWADKGHKLFYLNHSDIPSNRSVKEGPLITNFNNMNNYSFSVVDVKGTFNQNDSYRRFSIDQKWIWQKYKIYVQKIITHPAVSKLGKMTPSNALFYTTFVPQRFLFTDKDKSLRKINYPVVLLKDFLTKNSK